VYFDPVSGDLLDPKVDKHHIESRFANSRPIVELSDTALKIIEAGQKSTKHKGIRQAGPGAQVIEGRPQYGDPPDAHIVDPDAHPSSAQIAAAVQAGEDENEKARKRSEASRKAAATRKRNARKAKK
jgi:hypothetical protein